MATALSENSIKNVEDKTDDILTFVQQWEEFKSDLQTTLNNEVGKKFSEGFAIGATASNKIIKISDILLGMEDRINSLIRATYDFCDDQRRANEAAENK